VDERPRALLNLNLPCDRRAPAAVRQALSCLAAAGPSLGDATLVASELVASAVRHTGGASQHAGSAEDDAIDVEVRRFDQRLHITVRDPVGSQRDTRAPSLADCAADGLGRLIVEKLTCRWGSERQRSYVVWAELALSAYGNAR
jgi:anti-sigma regulatory factor (Ser/Thr protein kinase)